MKENNKYISKKAKIHSSVSIGPYCVIGDNVEIDENCKIYSHVSILGNTKIKGQKWWVYPGDQLNVKERLF